jgi:hypothetical protein
VKLSTELVDNSVDDERESGPSADSAGQFAALARFSPLRQSILEINRLRNDSGRGRG